MVIAVGAEPAQPDIPGLAEAGAVWAGDVFADLAETHDDVVIIGGGGMGCEAALHLARKGRTVTVVEMLPEAALDFNVINRPLLLALLEREGVGLRTGCRVVEVRAGTVVAETSDGERTEIPAESIVSAVGLRPRTEVVAALKAAAPCVSVVGDCVKPRLILQAVVEGFEAAIEI